MIKVTTPLDNKQKKKCSSKITGFNVLKPSLLEKAIALKINGKLYDLSCEIEPNAEIEIIQLNDEIGLDIIRHDAAHIMAQAVKELFPEAKIAIGPTVQDGFYYDFAINHTLTTNDLIAIEKK